VARSTAYEVCGGQVERAGINAHQAVHQLLGGGQHGGGGSHGGGPGEPSWLRYCYVTFSPGRISQ
jgi:hypothetical protein